mmetsp:Transcript_12070/g.29243  ORF Transcript_12070/g.29243 Transcript_12070/m.29243 type:complete len:224 (-) Transcript_12070:4043-4714(-)
MEQQSAHVTSARIACRCVFARSRASSPRRRNVLDARGGVCRFARPVFSRCSQPFFLLPPVLPRSPDQVLDALERGIGQGFFVVRQRRLTFFGDMISALFRAPRRRGTRRPRRRLLVVLVLAVDLLVLVVEGVLSLEGPGPRARRAVLFIVLRLPMISFVNISPAAIPTASVQHRRQLARQLRNGRWRRQIPNVVERLQSAGARYAHCGGGGHQRSTIHPRWWD